jgi:hypothetical protein
MTEDTAAWRKFGDDWRDSTPRALMLADSQDVQFHSTEQPIRMPAAADRLGDGDGALAIAQTRCRWWIEGMLRLVVAIESAPDLTPTELRRHKRELVAAGY